MQLCSTREALVGELGTQKHAGRGHCSLAREIRDRLPERRVLTNQEMHVLFWPDLPMLDLFALLELIERKLSIQPGVLRPEDDLTRLLHRPSWRHPLRRLRLGARLVHAWGELHLHLANRMRGHARNLPADFQVRTVDDLVHAWCGMPLG